MGWKSSLKRMGVVLCAACFFWSGAGTEAEMAQKIIYVPIDNRPVNLKQTVDVAERLGYEVAVPPEELLGSWDRYGDPEGLWTWLRQEAYGARAAVISTDAMLYGSLVYSRMHDFDEATVQERAGRFEQLHEDFPRLPIYALGTIMRTPHYNSVSGTEPEYYATYGERFFRYSGLKDKEETEGLTGREKKELQVLAAEIPADVLADWLERRSRNYDANAAFISMTRNDVFRYFLLGCDDSAMHSQTHLESRHLAELTKDLGKTRAVVASGADELGMLMLSRAINDLRRDIPFLYVQYNEGKGRETVPSYSNDEIGNDVAAAIAAAGGIQISSPARADLVVAVNTAYDGRTMEAANPANTRQPRRNTRYFTEMVKDMAAKGYPVAVADISCANGADNALMEQLRQEGLQFRLRAYGGWNTATNTTGFLIGSGVLAKWLGERDVYEMLLTRYLDDWAYQANVRQAVASQLYSIPGDMDGARLGGKWEGVNRAATSLMQDFARDNLLLPAGVRCEDLQARLPWSRLFECDPSFVLTKQ